LRVEGGAEVGGEGGRGGLCTREANTSDRERE
jgi:hypothetical protein